MDSTDPMLAAALSYATRGWRVFPNNTPVPLEDGSISCSCPSGVDCPEKSRGKHPRLREWQARATTAERCIRQWWSKTGRRDWRGSNVGIACGLASDLLVLDVDHGEGLANLEALAREGKVVPRTVTVVTGGGGRQFYLKHPDADFDPDNKKGLKGLTGIDIRTDGGQVVAPPSMHRSGNRYRFAEGLSPDDVPVADCPEWLIEMLRDSGKPKGSRTIHGLPRPKPVEPEAHIQHLHPNLTTRFCKTSAGKPRHAVTSDLDEEWLHDPSAFEAETRLLSAMADLWLPRPVREGVIEALHDRRVPGVRHPYETTVPGRDAKAVRGGEWTSNGVRSYVDPSLNTHRLWMRLLLGRLRIAVPWEWEDADGFRQSPDSLDTLLLPIRIQRGDGEDVDIWAADPVERAGLVAPFRLALSALAGTVCMEAQASAWAEGFGEVWLAIHSAESLPKESLTDLRAAIVDLAVAGAPEAVVRDARGHRWPGSAETGDLVYRVGHGNLCDDPCPLPFSFHPQHPERMMVAFDLATGAHHDQIPHLLDLRRRPGLAEVIEHLPALRTRGRRRDDRCRKVVGWLGMDPDEVSKDRAAQILERTIWATDPEEDLAAPSPPQALREDGEVREDGSVREVSEGVSPSPPREGTGSGDDDHVAGGGHTAAPTRNTHERGNREGLAEEATTEGRGVPDSPTLTPPHPSSNVGHKFQQGRWRTRLPDAIEGLHSTMIGSGFLARVLAAMRDGGLLDDARPGRGVLLELEDEVVRRYAGEESDASVRGEMRRFIAHDLPHLEALSDAAPPISPERAEGCRALARRVHPLLPTRGWRRRPSVEAITDLLLVLLAKFESERQAGWTLDFVAVEAGWAEDLGTDGVTRIARADRIRLSRFLARICEDYHRDSSGRVRTDAPPPLIPLLRCEQKGFPGKPSLYTSLWENWGEAFAELAATPCPPRRGDEPSYEEMIEAGFLVRANGR